MEVNNMGMYWQIVPTGDGYHYLGIKNGEYISYPKSEGKTNLSLIFKSLHECDNYIHEHLDSKVYNSEELWLDEKYFGLE